MYEFAWHENKRLKNLDRHKLDFVDAHEVFLEGNMYVVQSVKNGEKRYIGFGAFRGKLTAVVFVPRGKVIRIISWRRARDQEIKRYEEEHEKPDELKGGAGGG